MRVGLIAEKLGMMRIFSEKGQHIPVTVLAISNCQVVSHKTREIDGYSAIQIGAGNPKVKNVTPVILQCDADNGFASTAHEKALPMLAEAAKTNGIRAFH